MPKVLKVRDVMEREVISVHPSTTLENVWNTFRRNHISGAPVVDSQKGLVGVISQTDIVSEAFLGGHQDNRTGSYYIDYPFWDIDDVEDSLKKLGETSAEEVMNPNVITVTADDEVSRCAVLMRTNHVHRVLVVEGSKVIGIVTSMGLIQILEQH